jgi:hypothetical protein
MFRCFVELGSLPGADDRFERAYRDAVQQMKATLDAKAAEERAEHAYQNRTGDLEKSTTATEVISAGERDLVQLQADTPYAVYVNRRGLMRIDALAAEAETELAYLFDGLLLVI